jgi:TonB family protein
MTWTLDIVIRTSLVLGAGLAVAAVLRHRRAALRHAVLAGAIFGSALVPAGRLLPPVTLYVQASPAPVVTSRGAAAAVVGVPAVASTVSAHDAGAHLSRLAVVWCAGCLIVVALLGADVIRLRRLAASAAPMDDERWRQSAADLRKAFGIGRTVRVLVTPVSGVLATSGWFRPRVYLPRDAAKWTDERMRIVLAHEMGHIRRGDWAIQIAAEIVRAMFWFNPLAWIACDRLRRESEHACDDVVVGAGAAPADYAAHLLDIARTFRPPLRINTAMTMARTSHLHRRIAIMLNSQIDHRSLPARRISWMFALVCAAGLSVVAIQAKQANPAPLDGTIYDPTGAVLPGVTLTLRDANGVQQTATSDGAGRFEFPMVSPGRHRLTTSVPGFHTLDTQFELSKPQDWDRSITLQVGTLQETITVSAERFGGPAAAGGASQPVRVGGEIKPPLKQVDVRPVYPPEMRAEGREGVVPLEAVIRPDGTVGSVRVLSAEVHPDFAIAAVDAVRQWRFTPTLLNGKPVEVLMNVSITFKLAD